MEVISKDLFGFKATKQVIRNLASRYCKSIERMEQENNLIDKVLYSSESGLLHSSLFASDGRYFNRLLQEIKRGKVVVNYRILKLQ